MVFQNIIQTSGNIGNNSNVSNNNNSRINIKLENKKMKSIIQYNIYELNNLPYNEALKSDKRNYIQYYLSLVKTKHILIFSFFSLNDHNSRIIKVYLFLFSFTIYFVVNALFFNDSTMHNIYINNGSYNLNYQIVQIVYSSLISSILNIILKTLALTEKNVLKIKQSKNKNNLNIESTQVIKCIYYKFILFFIIAFILLLLFWYYLTSFCAIYENTQYHLIKDTLISFGLSMIYPFEIYLIPGIFRIPSLRVKGRETMYKFSKILQAI